MRFFRNQDEEDPFEAFDSRTPRAGQPQTIQQPASDDVPSLQNCFSFFCANPQGRLQCVLALYTVLVLTVVAIVLRGPAASLPVAIVLAMSSVLASLAVALRMRQNLVQQQQQQRARSTDRFQFSVRRTAGAGGAGAVLEATGGLRGVSAQQLRLLMMNRDFDSSDYEALLALDAGGRAQHRGAAASQLDRLPRFRVTHSGPVCSICLDPIACGEEARMLPCFHQFHVPCVDTWLVEDCTCPVCKVDPLGEEMHGMEQSLYDAPPTLHPRPSAAFSSAAFSSAAAGGGGGGGGATGAGPADSGTPHAHTPPPPPGLPQAGGGGRWGNEHAD